MSAGSTSGVRTIGVVGSGGIAPAHVWAWRRLGLEVVLASTNPDSAAVLAARFGAAALDDLDSLLAIADVVDICTPTASHPTIAAAAAGAGRAVVCEKPLALTADDAATLAATCVDAGVALYPAHVVRYFPSYAAAHAAVTGGRIGRLTDLALSRRSAAPERAWFAQRGLSGGVVMDQLIHDIDYARWVAGEVVAVHASTVDGPFPPQQRATVELTHAGGAVSRLTGEWGGPEVAFATSFTLVGTLGTITDRSGVESGLPSGTGATAVDERTGAPIEVDVAPPWQNDESPYLAQAAEFLAALRGGPAPRVTAADGVAAVAIAEAANRSVSTGATIDL